MKDLGCRESLSEYPSSDPGSKMEIWAYTCTVHENFIIALYPDTAPIAIGAGFQDTDSSSDR